MSRLLRLAARYVDRIDLLYVLGLDVARTPGPRVAQAASTLATMRTMLPLPEDDELLVRTNGAVQITGGHATDARQGSETLGVGSGGVADPHDHGGARFLDDRGPCGSQAAAGPVPEEHGDAWWICPSIPTAVRVGRP